MTLGQGPQPLNHHGPASLRSSEKERPPEACEQIEVGWKLRERGSLTRLAGSWEAKRARSFQPSMARGRANAHGQAKVCKSTPLHLAALSGNAELVKLLLQYQTKVNQQNSAGKSVLHFAAVGGHLEIIRILLSAGACLETRDSQGRNAHDYAVEKGQKAAAEALETRVARKATDAEPEEDGIMLTFEKLETQEIEAKAKRDEAYNNMRKNFDKVRMGQDHKDGGGRGIWVPLDDNKRNKAGKPPAVRGGRGGAGLLDEDKKNADRPRRNGRLNSDPLDSPGQVKDLGGEDDEDSGSQSPLDFKEFMEKQFEAIIGMESIKNMLRSLCRKVAVDQRRAKSVLACEPSPPPFLASNFLAAPAPAPPLYISFSPLSFLPLYLILLLLVRIPKRAEPEYAVPGSRRDGQDFYGAGSRKDPPPSGDP
eukprot:154560-Hanusia_phi.AAC.2